MQQVLYNKENPFLASITDRYPLSKPGSEKNTFHIVLNLKGSGFTYKVGDSIAVLPTNHPELVENTLAAMNAKGTETVIGKHSQQSFSLKEYLLKKANLNEVSRKFISEMAQRQTDPEKKQRLDSLLIEGQREKLKEYQASHEIWDALLENSEASFTPQELCQLMLPLLPRFYSIASSMQAVGEEVHLTVAELQYETNGHRRYGVCTFYLSCLTPLNEASIPIYMHPSNGFTVPENNDAPMIMVGPGTGVAPFRGFMQERIAKNAKGLSWLFFGERHRELNFFYEDYWQHLVKENKLRLDTAFSRDQEHKIYVQHRLLEHGKEVFALLEKGAYFYVCGDAHRMAKDVDSALHQIIQIHGRYQESDVKDYVKRLKAEKRYLRDVY